MDILLFFRVGMVRVMIELVGLGEMFNWLLAEDSFNPVLIPEYLAMKTSLRLPEVSALTKVVVPKVMMGLEKLPVIYALPLKSVRILLLPSPKLPPAEFAHIAVPSGAYFTIKISAVLPETSTLLKTVVPKVMVLLLK